MQEITACPRHSEYGRSGSAVPVGCPPQYSQLFSKRRSCQLHQLFSYMMPSDAGIIIIFWESINSYTLFSLSTV
ncbi:MAG TPA: hypothetical protein DCS74_04215 [Veillonellaceae bacterium]|nr:hypothetical protein [Veillonellaceae bacterium]